MYLSSNYIKKIHKTGFAWIFPGFGGKYRKIDVQVSQHIPPKHYRVEEEMKKFFDDLKVRIKNLPVFDEKIFVEKLIETLSWCHHKFLWIHPFKDYNGRLARLLNNIVLLKVDLPPIELKVETMSGRKKYIQALQDADNGNLKKLEKIIKTAFIESLNEVDSNI